VKDLAETLTDAIPPETRLRTASVTAVAGNSRTLTVNLDGTSVVVPRLLGWTPYPGDVVLLAGSRGFWYALGCLGAQQAAPSPPIVPIVPPTTPNSGSNTFNAVDSGSFRNGGWRNDTGNVIQGDWTGSGRNAGAWFYGDAIKTTLTGKTVVSARLYVPRISGGVFGAQAGTLKRHNLAGKSGAPTWSGTLGTVSLPADAAAWVDLSVGEVQNLVNSGGGTGLDAASPYFVANAVAADRQSGTLIIDWRT
jgi:hypothetical protein